MLKVSMHDGMMMQHEQLRSKANIGHNPKGKQDHCHYWQTGKICKHSADGPLSCLGGLIVAVACTSPATGMLKLQVSKQHFHHIWISWKR
jgi:hypothetical protein